MKKRIVAFTLMLMVVLFAKTSMVYADQDSVGSDIFTNVDIYETDTSMIYKLHNYWAIQQDSGINTYRNPLNSYNSLKVPTQIKKIGNHYFIVDCYHNQVIYSENLYRPIKEWQVLGNNMDLPHSIASDGKAYLITDTENNRVLVYEWIAGKYQNTQIFENVGIRPHYIEYDTESNLFFAWSSMTGEMYIIKREDTSGIMYIDEIRCINELRDFYVRSFSILGDKILFPSGNNCYMIIADKNTFAVLERFPVGASISGMSFATQIGDYFYLSISTDYYGDHIAARLIRTSNLVTLAENAYEDLNMYFPELGVPYYINYFDGNYYITNHERKKSIFKFQITDNVIHDISSVY